MRWLGVCSVLAFGCGSDPASEDSGAGGSSGTGPDPITCVAGERRLDDGYCLAPGVPPSECAEGFTHDGNGACEPVLPNAPCAPGQLAIPGDAACRYLADCGAAPWGDAPVDADTQYVDAGYAGSDSDGSAQRPWQAIPDAIAAAEAGALIAIAAGSYQADVEIAKPVRLWGRCPQMVEVVGVDAAFTAIAITAGDVALRGIAVRGPAYAVVVSGGTGVTLDRLWMHDTGDRGMQIYDDLGETAVVIRDSLIESTERAGILVAGSSLTLERSAVRNVVSTTDPDGGWGVSVTSSDARRSTLTLASSVIEGNRGLAVSVWASDATVDGSVLAGTLPIDNGDLGRGLSVTENQQGERAVVEVRRSIIHRNHAVGVSVEGADLVIEATTLREMGPLEGASLPLDVRGVVAQPGGYTGGRANLVMRRSLVDDNLGTGVFVGTSDAVLESVRIRDTAPQPNADEGGMGIYLRSGAHASVSDSAIEGSAVAGIAVVGSTATVTSSVVRDTRAAASGKFGDGVLVLSHATTVAEATVAGTLVTGSVRAGVANFAGRVTLDGSTLECNAIHLDGEPQGLETQSGSFDFQAGATNVCRCQEDVDCLVQTSSLAPPEL